MPGNAPYRQNYTIACSCGTSFTMDARGFGKPRPCGKCGAKITVAWGRDPNTRKAVPVAMTQKKAEPKVAATVTGGPAAPPPVQDTVKAFCGCGHSMRVPAAKKNSPPRCPHCGKIMRIEDAPLDRPKGKIEKFERAKPSAPLLPLHLRAPLRARVKKGAQFFDCVCGDRVLIRTGAEAKPIQCTACDRMHILEIEGPPPPPGPTQESGAKPRGTLPAPSRPLLLGEFLCRCGEIQPPRTSRTGKNFECKKCGRKGNVEIDKAADGKMTTKPNFTYEPPPGAPAAAAAAPAKPGASAPAPVPAGPTWNCSCGAAIDVHQAMSKGEPSCPSCGRKIRLEKKLIVGTTRTVIRPVFSDPVPAAAPPPKKDDGIVSFEELPPVELPAPAAFTETAIFETSAGSPDSDAPPAVESDAQIALCECSAEILVSKRDVGHTIQCPACADVMTVEQSIDPRTRQPILSIRTLGTIDDADWKLEDFA